MVKPIILRGCRKGELYHYAKIQKRISTVGTWGPQDGVASAAHLGVHYAATRPVSLRKAEIFWAILP